MVVVMLDKLDVSNKCSDRLQVERNSFIKHRRFLKSFPVSVPEGKYFKRLKTIDAKCHDGRLNSVQWLTVQRKGQADA